MVQFCATMCCYGIWSFSCNLGFNLALNVDVLSSDQGYFDKVCCIKFRKICSQNKFISGMVSIFASWTTKMFVCCQILPRFVICQLGWIVVCAQYLIIVFMESCWGRVVLQAIQLQFGSLVVMIDWVVTIICINVQREDNGDFHDFMLQGIKGSEPKLAEGPGQSLWNLSIPAGSLDIYLTQQWFDEVFALTINFYTFWYHNYYSIPSTFGKRSRLEHFSPSV